MHVNNKPPCSNILCGVMKNLAIAQHWDTLCYATTHGGGYQSQIQKFEQGDYVYL